ncbi:unnamed protein product [Rotaria socialis]|uniref:SecA family profile domain-containing protein n=1 Tax=Rotaria socialis TaxID=392032 RepID=A0A818JRP8_9BILA|nr:unnamed protein product [Rotaria socialis]CAF4847579.1 unnamed protein product [Rotaria socialis]
MDPRVNEDHYTHSKTMGNEPLHAPKSMLEVLREIKEKFTLQGKTIEQLKNELGELEQLKCQCDVFNPSLLYLHDEKYANIDVLKKEIEFQTNENRQFLQKAKIEQNAIQSRLNDLELILNEHKKISSEVEDQATRLRLLEEHLNRFRYTNIAAIRENITKTMEKKAKSSKKLDKEKKLGTDKLILLESIEEKYNSLLDRPDSISNEMMTLLQSKGFTNPQQLDQKILEKKRIIEKLTQNQQLLSHSDELDEASVNTAFESINEWGQSDEIHIRKMVADARETLQRYVLEHSNYLNQEIVVNYEYITQMRDPGNLSQYTKQLGKLLVKCLSFAEFKYVSECIDSTKKVEAWQNTFHDYFKSLSSEIENCQTHGKMKELTKQLNIAKALGCVDPVYLHKFSTEGFGALYERYWRKVEEQSAADVNTLKGYISNKDYQQVAIMLPSSAACFSNSTYIIEIKDDLQCSLTQLIYAIKHQANMIENDLENHLNLSKLREIRQNVEKVHNASKEDSIMKLLDDTVKCDMETFSDDVDKILSNMVLKRVDTIQVLLDTHCFIKAEQSIENLLSLQSTLEGICRSKSFVEKIQTVRERLEKIDAEILKLDFRDIRRYPVISPRKLLEELQSLKENYPARYAKTYENMKKRIHDNITGALKELDEGNWKQRSTQISLLEVALCHIPEEWNENVSAQISRWKEVVTDEERRNRSELINCMKSAEQDDDALIRLGTIVEWLHEQNMNENLNILRQNVLKQLRVYREKVESSLNGEGMQSVLDVVEKIVKYKKTLGGHIPEIHEIYENVFHLIMNSIDKCCSILANIASFETTNTVDAAVDNVIVFTKLSFSSAKISYNFNSSQILKLMETFTTVCEYFTKNSESYKVAILEIKTTDLKRTMNVSRRWTAMLEKLKMFFENTSSERAKIFSEALAKATLYSDMCVELGEVIENAKCQLNVELISQETILFPEKRDILFRDLMECIDKLRQINSDLKDFLPSTSDLTTSEKRLKLKIEILGNQLLTWASNERLTSAECDKFRIYYNHLSSFAVNNKLEEIDIKTSFLDKSEMKVLGHVTSLSEKLKNSITNIEDVAAILCRMKFFAENLSMFDSEINRQIDEDLKFYKKDQGILSIEGLIIRLQETDTGSRLIAEHSCFKGENWRKRRTKMQKQDDLDYVISNLSGDDMTSDVKDILRTSYNTFRSKYDEIVSQLLGSFRVKLDNEPNLIALIKKTKLLVPKIPQNAASIHWDSTFANQIPTLVAHIFAVWTLKNTQHYNESHGINGSQEYLLMPHVAQVIAIFRMLGIGYIENQRFLGIAVPMTKVTSGDVINNLVQIGTGEGKSVVIAIAACVFALTGLDVMCSCYSKYLSMRDRNDFASVFQSLGIEENIDYGTFNELCEKFLNKQCNLREEVSYMILNNKNSIKLVQKTDSLRPKVLLIDEVDIFLSEKFYGGIYTPAICLKSAAIKSLLDTLWQNRNLLTLNDVKASPVYRTCTAQFSNWIFLFDEAIQDMLFSLKTFRPSIYIVQNDKIAYVDGDSIVENIVRGYDTIWAYYYENQRGFISENSFQTNVGIIINCGTFSYAELPRDFAYISGVTGTLETLADSERNILREVYHISKSTYMPSVFGKSNRNYNSANDVEAVDQSEYFMRIFGEIKVMCDSHRAILVFFESEEKLMAFYNSSELSSIKEHIQIITEKVSPKERELCIKRATAIGNVTLLTRTFGRGTDFICENSQLLGNGGVHVLQTFFSEELAEEYQIMGRGARQGDRGSYRMILLDSDLEWVLGNDWAEKVPTITGSTLYKALHEKRHEHYQTKCRAKELGIEQYKHKHKDSKEFMRALSDGRIDVAKNVLREQNRGANIISKNSRTILLMDATGSMSNLLAAAKDTVCTMFERAADILKEKRISEDAFSMQFAVYRNYNSRKNKILEVSSWEAKATNLRIFMSTIGPEGGMGNEAIEIGLWHAVQQSETEQSIAQVILIGDAPANSKVDVANKRGHFSESYWKTTEFHTPTYYEDELKRLKDKKIPVHTFYLTDYAASNFKQIAKETNGRCESLNIYSEKGALLLTNFVTEEVLRKAAGDEGDDAVKRYREKYKISHT